MLLRDVILHVGVWEACPNLKRIVARLEENWGGARVYMTVNAGKRLWSQKGRQPYGAAERLAAEIESAIRADGGTDELVDAILLSLIGERFSV